MGIFSVIIEEINSKIVEIEAEDEGKALEIVEQQYQNGEIELDKDCDYPDYTISLL